MYMDMLQNNEAIQVVRPVPLLTTNTIYRRYDVMAIKRLPQVPYKKREKRRVQVNIGDRYGYLTVVNELDPIWDGNSRRRQIQCQCVCGNIVVRLPSELRRKQKTPMSCGCTYRKRFSDVNSTHKLSKHPLHKLWKGIKKRCENKNDKYFHVYGGRGISVCDEWANDFKSFYDWAIDNNWEQGLYIDRIDANGDYSPDNCRFVNSVLNAQNTRLLRSDNKTGYRGVKETQWGSYTVNIRSNNQRYYVGTYYNPIDAAIAYDLKAIELGGEHPLNFLQRPDIDMVVTPGR